MSSAASFAPSPSELRLKKRPPPPPPSKKPLSLRSPKSSPSLATARSQHDHHNHNDNTPTSTTAKPTDATAHAPLSRSKSTVISPPGQSRGPVPSPPPPRPNADTSLATPSPDINGDGPPPPLPKRASPSPVTHSNTSAMPPPPLPARNKDQARRNEPYSARAPLPSVPPRSSDAPSPTLPSRKGYGTTGSVRRLKAPPVVGATNTADTRPKEVTDGRRVVSSRSATDRVSSLEKAPPLPSRQSSIQRAPPPSRSPAPRLPSREPRAAAVPPTPPLSTSTSPSLPARAKPAPSVPPRQPPRPSPSGVIPAPTPPPIPLSTRPDSIDTLTSTPTPTPARSDCCMTCRDFSQPDAHAARYSREVILSSSPSPSGVDLRWLALELTGPFPSATDKARAIFTWLHHNIAYDTASFFSGCVRGATGEETVVKGAAVCDGYAGLFELLARHSGLEARKLSGHGKGFGYAPLAADGRIPEPSSNHAWNAVCVDGGEWKLVDACWGAGNVKNDQTYEKVFKPSFFTAPNTEFTLKHFPLQNGAPAHDSLFFFPPQQRPPSWEEYMRTNADCPDGIKRPIFYGALEREHGIGAETMRPLNGDIPVSAHPRGPLQFSFALKCPHWSVERHSGKPDGPCLFLLCFQGRHDGRPARIPFQHVRRSADGAGDFWFVDIEDPSALGRPGDGVMLNALNTLGDRHSSRGMRAEEYHAMAGKVGCSFSGVAQWKLV